MVEPLRQVTRMWSDDDQESNPCTFYYDPNEPYLVTVETWAPTREAWVTWEVGRDLLAAGLDQPVGNPAGDVLVWPHGRRLVLEIRGEHPDGGLVPARFTTSRAPVAVFLRLTHGMVPAGEEHLWLDWDRLAAKLQVGDTPC